MKKCKNCHRMTDDFGNHPETRDRLKAICRVCCKAINNEYKRSKTGLPSRMFNNQKVNSKRRGHAAPEYSIKELRKWLVAQPLFHTLYDNWKASGYERELVPSCDRNDDSLPYTLKNLTLMTWKENKAKGHKGIREGTIANSTLLCGGHRKVKRIDKITGEERMFISLSEAVRNTPGVHQGNISKVLAGTLKSTGGFLWR